MASRFDSLPQRRAIIDRRDYADLLALLPPGDPAAMRQQATGLMKHALSTGRDEIAARLLEHPSRGLEAAAAQAFLIDQIVRLLYDFITERLYPRSNATTSERITVIAVGGYGRGEMAPFSDVDIGFLTPWKQTGWSEQVIESMLYALWDLGLKVGHSSRSLDEMVRQARLDMTIRTALLEARYVWGDADLYDEAARRFRVEVQTGTERQFIADKLAERNERHRKMGDTRYVVEPNVKEGKGGLRDLHTLFWMGKYAYRVAQRGRAGRGGAADPDRISPVPPRGEFPVGGAMPPAHHHRPRRRAADLRRPARDRRADALCRPCRRVAGRAFHAALFPPGEGSRRPYRRFPGASRRDLCGAGPTVRATRIAPQPAQARRVRARPRAAGAAVGRFFCGRPRPADRDFLARRPARPGNPPAGDAHRGARCKAC